MDKKELIDEISQKTTITKTQIKQVVDETFSFITDAMSRGEKFKIIGFGSFEVVKRAPRLGVNPRTGEKISIKAKKIPVFTPGKKLLDSINKSL
jgi:DNA-binding protein HU-beta